MNDIELFGRRLHFQAVLRTMSDDGHGHVIDLSTRQTRAEFPGVLAVLEHACELGITRHPPVGPDDA